MKEKEIVLIDNFDSFTFNLYQMLAKLLGDQDSVEVIRNDCSLDDIIKMQPKRLVISPGPGRPPDDTGICREAIKHFAGKIPVLGICLGHQTIGHVFGGKIVRAKQVMHGKTSRVRLLDGVFMGMLQGMSDNFDDEIEVGRYHSLVVERKSLPDCLKSIAESSDGEIMAVEHQSLPNLVGLQFHPESLLTANGGNVYEGQGNEILKTFLAL